MLDNQYVFWIITGTVGLILGTIGFLVKRAMDKSEKRMEQIEATQKNDHDRLERTLRELPLTYTLREEFLRVTSQQSNKLDKIIDAVGEVARDVAALKSKGA